VGAIGFIETLNAAVEPTMSKFHRILCISVFTGKRWTFIKCHNNVGAYCPLDIHYIFWRKQVLTSINMTLEHHYFRCNLPGTRERKDLVSTAIGEDWLVPVIKLVESTSLL